MDIEDELGEIPMPSEASQHPIVWALFDVGPVLYDGYVTWQELESWQNITGVDLDPWEASLVIELSKAYLHQREVSRSMACICPWSKGQNIWKYVQDEKYKKERAAEDARIKDKEEKEPHGTRKRHRNPPKG